MQSIIEALRSVLGEPDFYKIMNPNSSQYSWDYGAMFEYFFAGMVLLICVSSIFKFVLLLVKRR